MSNNNLKAEIVYFLRNSDVFSTSVRGVTTTTEIFEIDSDTEILIERSNVKNVRSIDVEGTDLYYGDDYYLDVDYFSTTKKAKITFRNAQTGTVTIVYDYGTDKIWTDMPRDDLTINSYPRITVEELSKSTSPFSLGGEDFISSRMITIIVFSENQDFIEATLDTIESLMRANAKLFSYIPFISPTGRGPIIKQENKNQTILHRNVDFLGSFEVN